MKQHRQLFDIMGWLSFSHATASTDTSDVVTESATTTCASTEAASPPANADKSLNAAKAKAAAAEQPALSEAEQLDLLVGGARLDDTAAQDKAAFLGSNKRHMYLDGFLGCAVYTFSGLQHIQGQSNALTLLTMWTVGTTFLVDAGERKYLQDALLGTLPTIQKANTTGAAAGGKQQRSQLHGDDNNSSSNSAMKNGETSSYVVPPSASNVNNAVTSTMVPAVQDPVKLAEQQRKIFMTQAVASWVWMLASFQQFKVHKRLKWCGYSSWMGLGCVAYYTTRHVYNLLVE